MKNILTIPILFLILSHNVHAQSKEESRVAHCVENLRKAMVDANAEMLNYLTMDELSYGHSGGALDNKKEFVDKIVSGRSDFVSIDLSNQTIQVTGKTAIVRHKLSAKTNDGGKAGEVNLLVVLVWQKNGGKWKLLARQAVKAV